MCAECSLSVAYRCTIHHLSYYTDRTKSLHAPLAHNLACAISKKKRHSNAPSPPPYNTLFLCIFHRATVGLRKLPFLSRSPYKDHSPPPISHPNLSQIKPKPLHTTPVLAHQVHARCLRILGRREQHALVASGFFVFADAAGLDFGRAFGAGGFVGGGEVVDLGGVGG